VAVVQYTHTNNTQNNTKKQNTQNRIYITIRIHKNKNTKFTELNRSVQNIQPYIQCYKMEPKEYERIS
jgi:hypothetical protein